MSNQLEKLKSLSNAAQQHVSAVVKKRLPNSTKKENIHAQRIVLQVLLDEGSSKNGHVR